MMDCLGWLEASLESLIGIGWRNGQHNNKENFPILTQISIISNKILSKITENIKFKFYNFL